MEKVIKDKNKNRRKPHKNKVPKFPRYTRISNFYIEFPIYKYGLLGLFPCRLYYTPVE